MHYSTRAVIATILVAAAQVAATACSDDPTKPPQPPPKKPTMVIVSGDGQRAEVGTSLPVPLVVRVADGLGSPAARVVVHFSSTTQAEDSSTTDSQGVAAVGWTLGSQATTQEIVARATVDASIPDGSVSVTFKAVATAGVPARVTLTGGDGAVAAPGTKVDTVAVVAFDRFGNPSPGAPAAWLVTAGGGSIRPIANQTDAAGIAQAIWIMGPGEGVNTLDVTLGTVTRQLRATASETFPGTMVVAGDGHTCALANSGAAYCWGANSSGQLGARRTDDNLHTTPQRVAGGLSFASLVAGGSHTCGLTADGHAYCWGNGRSGQLGVGSIGLVAIPMPVLGSLTFTALAAGAQHTCGLTTARTLYCWGDNTMGQLGDGRVRTFDTPGGSVDVPTPVFATDVATHIAITAGSFSTCAIATNGGTYCWGVNSARELGGDIAGRCFVIATQFLYDGTPLPCSTAPNRLPIVQELGSLSASGSGWCGAGIGGDLVCWGNAFLRPQVVVGAGVKKAWVVGKDVCVLQSDDSVTCWGVWGRTGFPVVRPFGDEVQLGNFASGSGHSCGVSRDARGTVYCWGNNASGQIGDGTTATRILPAAVLSPRLN